MAHWTEQHFVRRDGPFAIVATCCVRGCRHSLVTKKPPLGSRGRGWGMREGNKQRGAMIQHVKAAHPELQPT